MMGQNNHWRRDVSLIVGSCHWPIDRDHRTQLVSKTLVSSPSLTQLIDWQQFSKMFANVASSLTHFLNALTE